MRFALPSVPYPAPGEGIWGAKTATLNFCEEDYYATIYSAEIVNTITNALFMYLAYKGYKSCSANGHDTIFTVAYIGCFAVAIGSSLFHSTLKYPMQLVDELSMIYTTCLTCYASFSHGRPQRFRVLLALGLSALALFITLYYHYLQNPLFHQNAYAFLTAIVLARSMYLMEVSLRPRWRGEARDGSRSMRRKPPTRGASTGSRSNAEFERDLTILKTMWRMVGFGLTFFLGGFAIWNLDNVYCSQWRRLRRDMGLPWGALLEGHGWWHIMTGIGAYYYLVWGIWLRHCLNGRQAEYRLRWPNMLLSLPEIVKIDRKPSQKASKSHGNGALKKVV
ncbi:MAG: hypothetical protein M1815_001410 [Lichina confinis]|nr:MAG: hypothetical protein M1815_001410 [Lichina confinis]